MRTPVSRYERTGALLVLLALVPLGFFFVRELEPGGRFNRNHRRIYITSSDALELDAGDKVLMRGIQIGEVDELELIENHRVMVTCTIYARAADKISADSKVWLVPPAVVGSGHIEIEPGSGQDSRELFDGEAKPTLESKITQLVENADRLLVDASLRIGELGTTLTSFERTLGSVDSLLGDLAAGKGSLGQLIVKDDVYERLDLLMKELQTLPGLLAKLEGPINESLPQLLGVLVSASRHLNGALEKAHEGLEFFPDTSQKTIAMLEEGQKILESLKRNVLIRGNLPGETRPRAMGAPGRRGRLDRSSPAGGSR